jgi:hypothetical protein
VNNAKVYKKVFKAFFNPSRGDSCELGSRILRDDGELVLDG